MSMSNPAPDTQIDKETLVDIRTCKRREKASRVENAVFLLNQIGNHTVFKVGDDIVEIGFANTGKTLSEVLNSHFKRVANKNCF